MRRQLLIFTFISIFCSCQNNSDHANKIIEYEKFDSLKWKIQNGEEYLYRDLMLNDLINNFKLKGLRKNAIINILGEPDRSDGYYLFYTIQKTKLWNLPIPLHTKTLVIKLAVDSTVEWRKIHE
jgi:hypothetical protein